MQLSRTHAALANSFSTSLAVIGFTLACLSAVAAARADEKPTPPTKPREVPEWVKRSNEHAQVLLKAMAGFSPETATYIGVEGVDEDIVDLKPHLYERTRDALNGALTDLRQRLEVETHPNIRQDLELCIEAAEQNLEENELGHKYELPYFDLPVTLFYGIRLLLDEQAGPERHRAALVRLRRYAGVEEGYTPIAILARDRIRERMNEPNLLGPPKRQLENHLRDAPGYIAEFPKLFDTYGITGYEPAYERLKKQLADYETFIRTEVLPIARTDFRQPPEMYAFSLRQAGIDMPITELISRARVAFAEIQEQMQALAPLVAKELGIKATDYRDVIRELKKDQLVGEAILAHYKDRIRQVEEIIRRERIVSLPNRPVRIHLASEAESAAMPSPHLRDPRLLGNTGEMGVFVLPLRVPSADPNKSMAFDDFTYAAGSWTLTAHEARPGHELQTAAMVEQGVSIPRAVFAMNSVNEEGWALYSEWEVKPYLPLDGQLISLQYRLLRAARAFLDPGVQMGTITPEEAMRVLTEEVVMSEATATKDVERYMFWWPGQAPSYFCGYLRLMELRAETELALADAFDRQAFNDFVLSQGVLPPALVRKAVMTEFIPKYMAGSGDPNP